METPLVVELTAAGLRPGQARVVKKEPKTPGGPEWWLQGIDLQTEVAGEFGLPSENEALIALRKWEAEVEEIRNPPAAPERSFRARSGRRPLSEEEVRDQRVIVLFNREEIAWLEKKATQTSRSLSALARRLILSARARGLADE